MEPKVILVKIKVGRKAGVRANLEPYNGVCSKIKFERYFITVRNGP